MSAEHNAVRVALAVLISLASGRISDAGSVRVTAAAALEGAFGFQVSLDDSQESWVGVGPDKGLSAETAVRVRFLMDLTNVKLEGRRHPSTSNGAGVCFLSLSREIQASKARVLLCAEHGRHHAWFATAWLWDNSSQRYVAAGRAKLMDAPRPRVARQPQSPLQMHLQWDAESRPAARDGSFRLSRTVDGQEEVLIERGGLANGARGISYLQVGVIGQTAPGTVGDLYLDAVEIERPIERTQRHPR